jgi:hypothetical protein
LLGIGIDQGEIDLDVFPHAGIGEALGDVEQARCASARRR